MRTFNLEAFVNRRRPNCQVTLITTYPERVSVYMEKVVGSTVFNTRQCISVNALCSLLEPRYALARILKDMRKALQKYGRE